MKKIYFIILVMFSVVSVSGIDSVRAADWRFPFGYTFISGVSDMVDVYENNLEEEGYDVDTTFMGYGGIAFNPYVELDMGLRLGLGLGPAIIVLMNEADHFELPVSANIGWSILPNHNISPYFRGGISYHIASGTYVVESKPGLMGAVGIEFSRKRRVGFGLELGIDTAEIELEKRRCHEGSSGWYSYCNTVTAGTETINSVGTMISVFAVF